MLNHSKVTKAPLQHEVYFIDHGSKANSCKLAGGRFCECGNSSYAVPVGGRACSDPVHLGNQQVATSQLPEQLCEYFKQVRFRLARSVRQTLPHIHVLDIVPPLLLDNQRLFESKIYIHGSVGARVPRWHMLHGYSRHPRGGRGWGGRPRTPSSGAALNSRAKWHSDESN